MRDRTLAAISAAAFLVFVVLAIAVKTDPSLNGSDLQAALWVNHLSLGEPLNSLLVAASVYGREYFWIPLVAVLFLLGDKRTKLVALGLCGVFVAGIAIGEIAKDIVARARPDQSFIFSSQISALNGPIIRTPLDTDYSFPSGHAVIVSIGAVYSLLTFRRKWIALLLLVEALVVGFSRVYTFEHFPTDVVAGFAIGSAITFAGLMLEKRYLRPQGEALTYHLVKLLREGPLKL
jgi:membrane-associated phospholipid phosphatase